MTIKLTIDIELITLFAKMRSKMATRYEYNVEAMKWPAREGGGRGDTMKPL